MLTGHQTETVKNSPFGPTHHGVGNYPEAFFSVLSSDIFGLNLTSYLIICLQVLFGMFVIAIACDQFEAIFSDETLVRFFKEVLARRDALDEEVSGDLAVTGVQLADGDPGDLDASQHGGLSA